MGQLLQTELGDMIRLYDTPPGSGIYGLKGAKVAAEARGDASLVAFIDEAIELGHSLDTIDHRRRQTSDPQYASRAGRLDAELDRLLSATAKAVEAAAVLHADAPADSPEIAAVARLTRKLFPRGVAAITRLSFVAQHTRVNSLLADIETGGELAEDMVTLGLGGYVARLRAKNDEYGDAIHELVDRDTPTASERRAANADFQRALQRVVAVTLGTYHGDDDESVAARRDILGPIQSQQARLRELYRRRVGVRDVDPETGEERELSAGLPPAESDVA